ncbi:hypothetical protein DL96DRAFT_1459646 [Flagelloscypha sp. PMI_526]|nr:hypothetical protein DL96DRAFT_1459646 [Flagelloscypha sp. PMI_526]
MATEEIITPPDSYSVGGKDTSPFVTLPQVQGHLALLNAFASLKTQVDLLTPTVLEQYKGLPNIVDRAGSSTSQQRWVCFVQLAVERFEVWCLSLTQEDISTFDEEFLPPIDVLMVWHSYMLNPGNYLEDSLRVPMCKYLGPLSPVFSKLLPKLPGLLNQPSSSSRQDNWDRRCSAWPFDPLTSAKQVQHKTFSCPRTKCSNVLTKEYVCFNGTGFLQKEFSAKCSTCNSTITRNHLVLRKLINDLSRESNSDLSHYLAGSLITARNTCDKARGERIKSMLKDVIMKQPHYPGTSVIESVLMDYRATLDRVEGWVTQSFKNEPGVLRMMSTVLDSYRCPNPFSTDLAAAVLRQFDFTSKMKSLPWGLEFKTTEDERPLIHAIARYHSFMNLMASRPGFYVPTLDIDLAWHTHQLSGVQYERDCFEYVGKFIDHDDKVSSLQLGDGFQDTCKAWQHQYGVRYAYCGCPIPDAKSIGQRLSRILNKPTVPVALTDHASDATKALAECTHPSLHSVVTPPTDQYRKKTRRVSSTLEKRSRAEKNEASKMKSDSKAPDDVMTQISSTKWAEGHRSYLQEVPLYFETPVSGCRSFSPPYKVIFYHYLPFF